MPLLFAVLTLSFVGIAVYAATAGEWVFVAVGAALAAWMGTFGFRGVFSLCERRRRHPGPLGRVSAGA
jgi:hypothetical protein